MLSCHCRVDVTEGQYTSIAVLVVAGLFGVEAWDHEVMRVVVRWGEGSGGGG